MADEVNEFLRENAQELCDKHKNLAALVIQDLKNEKYHKTWKEALEAQVDTGLLDSYLKGLVEAGAPEPMPEPEPEPELSLGKQDYQDAMARGKKKETVEKKEKKEKKAQRVRADTMVNPDAEPGAGAAMTRRLKKLTRAEEKQGKAGKAERAKAKLQGPSEEDIEDAEFTTLVKELIEGGGAGLGKKKFVKLFHEIHGQGYAPKKIKNAYDRVKGGGGKKQRKSKKRRKSSKRKRRTRRTRKRKLSRRRK